MLYSGSPWFPSSVFEISFCSLFWALNCQGCFLSQTPVPAAVQGTTFVPQPLGLSQGLHTDFLLGWGLPDLILVALGLQLCPICLSVCHAFAAPEAIENSASPGPKYTWHLPLTVEWMCGEL